MIVTNSPVCRVIAVEESSQVGEARRAATTLALEAGFSKENAARVALVATEAANNLIKHAERGEILLQTFELGGIPYIDLAAIDRGPGMENVGACMRDGFSTAGTPGTGLGAMKRMADQFDLHSLPGKGTAVFARWSAAPTGRSESLSFDIGVACAPHPLETVSGDSWSVRMSASQLQAVVADGLGHGIRAAEASTAAVEAFNSGADEVSSEALLEVMHAKLRATRGAAVSIAELKLSPRRSHFTGMGNVAGAILSGAAERKQMASLNGTLGHQTPRIRGFDYPWPENGLLVLHSDGIVSRCCDIGTYPGLSLRHPGLIAAVLLRDFRRINDDSTVLVARERRREPA